MSQIPVSEQLRRYDKTTKRLKRQYFVTSKRVGRKLLARSERSMLAFLGPRKWRHKTRKRNYKPPAAGAAK